MKYIDVTWKHQHSDEPVRMLMELDEHRYDTRVLEYFRDGRIDFASEAGSSGTTVLSTEPIPDLAEINADPQFYGVEISAQEFESQWRRVVVS